MELMLVFVILSDNSLKYWIWTGLDIDKFDTDMTEISPDDYQYY